MTYDVVLLIEQTLSPDDGTRVRSLHENIEDQVRYHLLVPMEDAAARVEAAMGSLSSGELMGAPPVPMSEPDIEAIREETKTETDRALADSVTALQAAGGEATGEITSEEPVDALVAKVKEVEAAEVIILTRPHVVSEFFHVDWSSRARRKLGVPVLHLLEHETFDEQASGPDGVSGA